MYSLSDLQAALARGGGKLLVGFQLRFHPTLQKAQALLQDGAIGKPYAARAHWGEYLPNWHPWEDYRQSYAAREDLGGGVLRTLCHPFDYLHMLLGEYQVAYALGGTLGDLGLQVEDTAEVGLRFESGAVGSVHIDYLQQPAAHTLEIAGTAGTLRWNYADGSLTVFQAGGQSWETFLPPEGFERNWLFLEELRNFIATVQGKAEPLCTLADGVRALEIVLQARRCLE